MFEVPTDNQATAADRGNRDVQCIGLPLVVDNARVKVGLLEKNGCLRYLGTLTNCLELLVPSAHLRGRILQFILHERTPDKIVAPSPDLFKEAPAGCGEFLVEHTTVDGRVGVNANRLRGSRYHTSSIIYEHNRGSQAKTKRRETRKVTGRHVPSVRALSSPPIRRSRDTIYVKASGGEWPNADEHIFCGPLPESDPVYGSDRFLLWDSVTWSEALQPLPCRPTHRVDLIRILCKFPDPF